MGGPCLGLQMGWAWAGQCLPQAYASAMPSASMCNACSCARGPVGGHTHQPPPPSPPPNPGGAGCRPPRVGVAVALGRALSSARPARPARPGPAAAHSHCQRERGQGSGGAAGRAAGVAAGAVAGRPARVADPLGAPVSGLGLQCPSGGTGGVGVCRGSKCLIVLLRGRRRVIVRSTRLHVHRHPPIW